MSSRVSTRALSAPPLHVQPEPSSSRAADERPADEDRPREAWPSDAAFIATCIDARHPTLQGRVRVRLETPAGDPRAAFESWVPTLHGQTFRAGDRVLLQRVSNNAEPIVVGVIDGFLPRPAPELSTLAQLELKRDEVLRVQSEDGQQLIELVHDGRGPVVRLLQGDVRLELRGKLSISAAELELRASQGDARIEASNNVCLVGELIHLN